MKCQILTLTQSRSAIALRTEQPSDSPTAATTIAAVEAERITYRTVVQRRLPSWRAGSHISARTEDMYLGGLMCE